MSLAVRSSYLNWVLGTTLGLILWFRNRGPDRMLGTFVFVVSLIFLAEYGLANHMDTASATQLILAASVLSVFMLSVVGSFQLPEDPVMKFFVIITLLLLIWGLWSIATGHEMSGHGVATGHGHGHGMTGHEMDDGTSGVTFCSWTNGNSHILWLSLIAAAVILIYAAFKFDSYSLWISLLILGGISLLLLAANGYYIGECFGYYFMLFLLVAFFAYWIIPYFDPEFVTVPHRR